MDRRYVEATPEQLAGLPQDFLDAHPADERGIIQISTDYPDYFPVMKYSTTTTCAAACISRARISPRRTTAKRCEC